MHDKCTVYCTMFGKKVVNLNYKPEHKFGNF